jgi:hypothetical protein
MAEGFRLVLMEELDSPGLRTARRNLNLGGRWDLSPPNHRSEASHGSRPGCDNLAREGDRAVRGPEQVLVAGMRLRGGRFAV